MKPVAALVLAAIGAAGAVAAPALPVGGYAGQLCVTVAAAPAADCGPAEVDVLHNRRLRVRISDIVYHLTLNASQIEVVLMHGTMQIDEFVAPFEWAGKTLRFDDIDKRTRYELRLAQRKPAAR